MITHAREEGEPGDEATTMVHAYIHVHTCIPHSDHQHVNHPYNYIPRNRGEKTFHKRGYRDP